MGTQGVFGFFYGGRLYLVYNHYDSYPAGLGTDLVYEIQQAIIDNALDDWIKMLEKIIVIDIDSKPTQKDKIRLQNYTDLRVGLQSTDDWYCLTRRCQGSMFHVLLSGYLLSCIGTTESYILEISERYKSEGILDDYQEYGYILNFDEKTFDVFGCTNYVKYGEDCDNDEEKQNKYQENIKRFPLSSLSMFFDFFDIPPKTSQTNSIPMPWDKKPLHLFCD